MTYVLTEIAMEMMGLKFYDMDGDFCETNFQGEDKKRKDKPNLLQALGLKQNEEGKLVNDSDNDDDKPSTSSRAKKASHGASTSGKHSVAKETKNRTSANVKKTVVPMKKPDTVNTKKSETVVGKMSDKNKNAKVQKTEVKLSNNASQGTLKKVAPGNAKVVNDSNDDMNVQESKVKLPIVVSQGAIKKVAPGNVKFADTNDNVNIQKTEMKLSTDASQGAIKKVASGNVNADNVKEQKTEGKLPTVALQDTIKKVGAGNIKFADEPKKQYKLRENPILMNPETMDIDTKPLKMLPTVSTDAKKESVVSYAAKFSALDLNTDESRNDPISLVKKETPLISVRSDLVAQSALCAEKSVPVLKRGNSLIKRTNAEFERVRSLLIKHKNNYIHVNGNIHHRMVLMGAYSPEKFMQPSLESEENNLKDHAELLYRYRCLLEQSLARNNPDEFKRIHFRYTLRKRMGSDE